MFSGARMSKLRSVLVTFLALVFSSSLAFPVEDLPETAYDESASLPYNTTTATAVSIPAPEAAADVPAKLLRCSRLRLSSLRNSSIHHSDRGTGAPCISHSPATLDHALRC